MVILFIARCDHPRILNSVLEEFGDRQLHVDHLFKDFIAVTIFSTNKDGVLAFTVTAVSSAKITAKLLSWGIHLGRSFI